MYHAFDTQVADAVGVNGAILFNHIAFWCEKNRANGEHCYDGAYWTYNSKAAFQALFPYMTPCQIKTALQKLLDAGLCRTGNYNENKYDRTLWYAVTEKGQSMLCKSPIDWRLKSNRLEPGSQPIPDNKPDINNTPLPPKGKTPRVSVTEAEEQERLEGAALPQPVAAQLAAWLQYKRERREGYTPTGLAALLTVVGKHVASHGATAVAGVIADSMANGWRGVCWDKLPPAAQGPPQEPPAPKAYKAPKDWLEARGYGRGG